MPGSSLWLVPPEESSLFKAIQTLIAEQIPPIFPVAIPPRFPPHVTLSGDITVSDESDAQEWLDSLSLPKNIDNLKLVIGEAEVGDIFFKKVTMTCNNTPELEDLAAACRAGKSQIVEATKAYGHTNEQYLPHCSLMYSDLPSDEVKSKLHQINAKIEAVKQQHLDRASAEGGSIWLVPTYKDIEDWKPVATRQLKDIEWHWVT